MDDEAAITSESEKSVEMAIGGLVSLRYIPRTVQAKYSPVRYLPLYLSLAVASSSVLMRSCVAYFRQGLAGLTSAQLPAQ